MTSPTEIYTLSLHDALPICRTSTSTYLENCDYVLGRNDASGEDYPPWRPEMITAFCRGPKSPRARRRHDNGPAGSAAGCRSEEHTSELQSLRHLVCRLLLEK